MDPSAAEHRGKPVRYRPVVAVGVALWAAVLVTWLVLSWRWRPQAGALALAMATFLYGGKLGSIPVGQSAGGNVWLVAAVIWSLDVGGLLVFFPFTQVGVEALERRKNRVSRWLAKVTHGAEKHRHWIDRWGPAGLFAFSLLPVYLNSPLVGAAVGRIAGLPAAKTLAALIAAITLMTAVWSALAWWAIRSAHALDPRLAWLIGLAFGVPPLVALGVRRLVKKPAPAG